VEGRDKKDLAQTAEDGPYGADGALARGLIDGIDYGDGAREAARKAVGAIRDDVVFGGAGTADGRESFADVVRMLGGEPTRHGPIALVKAVGGIRMAGGGGPFGGGGGITEKELGRVLARIEDADAIKAVVLRIDSPGGSALASDLLWHALMKVRAKKPVVVSVGEMAASGGYYLACTGNVIFATPGSIVGSIGVVGGKFGVGAALERWGVHAETFSGKRGDVAHANRATYDSALGAWDEPTKKRMLEQMESTYDLFLRRVAEGRRLPIETVRGFAEGKIFSGEEGQELHMVDELGGLEAAIVRARELAGLPSDAAVEVVGARPSLTDTLFGDSPFGGGDGEGRAPWAARLGAWALGAPMGPSEPALASSTRALWDAVASLGNAEHMATVLPFWLKGP
jgi:protease-4